MNKNVGVFLSAAFLTSVRTEHRTPQGLTSKVEEATKRVLAAGEPAVRVVVADCAVEEQRLIAEGFALEAGFRIRHAPALGPSVSATLSAEVLAAAAADDGLRVVAVGDDPVAQAATLEALATLKRWTVLISIDAARRINLADEVLKLVLDPRPLFDVVNDVLAAAADPRDFAAIHAETQRRFGPFSPKTYGFAATEGLVKAARKHAREHSPATSPAQRSHSRPPFAKLPTKLEPRLGERRDVRRAVLAQPPLGELDAANLSDLEIGGTVLDRLGSSEFASYVGSAGIDIHLFLECSRHLTSMAKWAPNDITTPELMMRIASEHSGWVVGVPPGRKDAHLVASASLPAGWTEYVARVDDGAHITRDGAEA